MRTRNNRWLGLALLVALVVDGVSLGAGEEPAAPWAAVAEKCAKARADYHAALEKVEAQYAAPGQKEDPAAIMKYLAARKAPQDAYLQALNAAAATAVPLAEGIDWHPAAAALAQEWMLDGQYETAAAAFDQALLPPWKAGADPAKFKAFREFIDRLPATQKAYLAQHQAWCCYRLGTLHERAGTPKLAVTLYRNALSLERRPRFLFALALASTLHSDFEQARELLVEASTATKQQNALIEYHLGYCLEKLWQLNPAAAAYDRAAALAAAAEKAATTTGAAPASFPPKPDSLGIPAESGAPADWNLDLTAARAEDAARRARSTAAAMTAGQIDGARKAYELFQKASQMNAVDWEEKLQGLHEVQRNFEEDKLLGEYEALLSQAVVAFPRFVPALVKAGIIKVNREEPEQGLILFQSALAADREDPSALIYFAQTALKVAGADVNALETALTPPAGGGPPGVKPDMPGLQKKWNEADQLLKPLPETGKRLAQLLDKHAIGFEICALAEWEQAHANTFRVQRDPQADRKLMTQAHRDYLQARRRGGRKIDLFEKMHSDAPEEPAAIQP